MRPRDEPLENVEKQIPRFGDRAGLHRVEKQENGRDVQPGQGGKEELAIDSVMLRRFARKFRLGRCDGFVDGVPPTGIPASYGEKFPLFLPLPTSRKER